MEDESDRLGLTTFDSEIILTQTLRPYPIYHLSTMRYYEQKYPEVDELVMVQVRQIAEMGAYVKLVRNKARIFCLTPTKKKYSSSTITLKE